MPQNWKTYKLEDLAERVTVGFVGSMAQEYVEVGVPMLRSQNIKAFNLDYSNMKYISNEFHKKINKSSLVENDVAIIRTGNPGVAAVIPKGQGDLNCSDLVIVTPNLKKINPYFLCYYFNSVASGYVNSQLVGAVQQHFNVGSAKKMEIQLPSIDEQGKIVEILKSINDKIELNLQQNQTLEEMAMALYKHWFVDFGPFQDGEFVESELGMIPMGWEVKRLDEIAENRTSTFNLKKVKEVVFINTGDVQEGRFLHSNRSEANSLPGQAKKVIVAGDILYSEIRPKNKRFAYVNFDSSEYVVSTKFMIIKSIPEQVNNRLLYRILTKQDSVDYFNMIADGRSGTFPQITFTAISDFQIALPEVALQNEFQDLVQSFELMQDELYQENQTLTTLRDTLLPKLISGEVRVKDVEELVKAAL